MTEQEHNSELDLRMRKNSGGCREEIMSSTLSEVAGMSTILNETTVGLAVYLTQNGTRKCIRSTDARRTAFVVPARYKYGQRVSPVHDKKCIRVTDDTSFLICAMAKRANESTGETLACEGFIESAEIGPGFFKNIGIGSTMTEIVLYHDVRYLVTVDVYKRRDYYLIAGCNIIVEPGETHVSWPQLDSTVSLQSLEKMRVKLCEDFADRMLSMPLWHNQFMVSGEFETL